MPNSSMIYNHVHTNFDILEFFSEDTDNHLLYRGQPIGIGGTGTGSDSGSIVSEQGLHDLRYFNNKLQYKYDGIWTTIQSGSSIGGGVPDDNALLSDLDDLKVYLLQLHNQDIDLIHNALCNLDYSLQTQKSFEFNGNNNDFEQVTDITTLIDNTHSIIHLEILIQNVSNDNELYIQILENNILTEELILKQSEVQKYKLSNIRKYIINAQGEYNIFLYINYI